MWGGEHEARTPVDTGMWALDLEEEEGAAMVWRRLDTRGDPPSPRSASRDTFRAGQLFLWIVSWIQNPMFRFGHGQCAVGGRLYVFGGRAGTAIDEQLMSDLHCWDPATAAWSPVVARGGAPPCPRSFHSMVAPPGGSCFYVFGGCPQQGRLADLHR